MPRVLSQRHLNRALLARQLLLERRRMSIPKALERIGGIQAQYAPSMYVGLATRLERFERDELTRALERRSVVQGTLMRVTIHLVSRSDYWPFAIGVREASRQRILRSHKHLGGDGAMAAAANRLAARIAGGTLTQREIREMFGAEVGTWVGLWLDAVRVPPAGTWERRRADIYAAAADWVGEEPDIDRDDAVAHLVRAYLRGFGPAPRADIAAWAGIKVGDVSRALERLELRRFTSEQGDELLDVPRSPLPDPNTPAPVRLLPVWDATLLANLRRTGILPERHRPLIFNSKNPQSHNTFIVDGAVAGTWRHEDGGIRLDPFEPLDRPTLAALRDEADRMEALFASGA